MTVNAQFTIHPRSPLQFVNFSLWFSTFLALLFLVLTSTASSLPLDALFVQVLCDSLVGDEDLRVTRAGVTKLISFVGVAQVTCQTPQLFGDVKVAVLLAHHLPGDPFQAQLIMTIHLYPSDTTFVYLRPNDGKEVFKLCKICPP